MTRMILSIALTFGFACSSPGQDERPMVLSNSEFTAQPLASPASNDVRQPGQRLSIPLPPPGDMNPVNDQKQDTRGPLFTVTSSLAIVLGLFCGFVWLTRKTSVGKGSLLGSDLFAVLGTSQLDARHRAALVKCGDRVLLVALTQAGVTTLTEFTDRDEVNQLLAQTSGRSKASFADALKDAGDGKPASGFVDSQPAARRSLFSHGGA